MMLRNELIPDYCIMADNTACPVSFSLKSDSFESRSYIILTDNIIIYTLNGKPEKAFICSLFVMIYGSS